MTPRPIRDRRAHLALVLVTAVALALAGGCAAPPDPRSEAERLAADLADGTVDTATTSNAAAEADLAALLGDLAEVPRTVEVGELSEVEEDGEARDVALTWTWDLAGDAEWVVATTARLELVEGAWVTRWKPTLVHPDAAAGSTLDLERVPAVRGDILSTDGTAVVTHRPVYRIGIDKAHAGTPEEAQAAALELATRLGFDDPAAFAARVAAAGTQAYVVAITVRQSEAEQWDVEGLKQLPGVLVQEAEVPLAPTATFARPLLGTVGEATAEIVADSGGAIVAGDQVGLSGLQRQYDDRLRGTPGVRVLLTATDGRAELFATDPVDGQDLTITLQEPLQLLAESLLADVGSASAIVAVQPSTGHVLAAASGPGGGGLNTAAVGLYPPGSTFKVATTLALLRAGVTPETLLECGETVTVDGRAFQNHPGYPAASLGAISLGEALAQSCNTAFIGQHGRVTAADVAAAAEALGIGVAGTWPFPYASGEVPGDATGTSHAAGLIGQGGVLASPLAMAVVAASVAAGTSVVPVVVTDEAAEVTAPAAPLTAAEAGVLRDLMRSVVTAGNSTFLADVPGDPVGAKSGTAQFGTADPPQTHAWMIAFQGDLAVAVFVEVGDYGTATAGPILESFLRGSSP